MKDSDTEKKGFGVIEVLISATIIAMMLGALVSVGSMAARANQNLLERSQAAYIAQEGLEIVRQMRDTAWIDGDPKTRWDSFGIANQSVRQILEHQHLDVAAGVISYNSNPGQYRWTQGAWTQYEDARIIDNTLFQRQIRFSKASGILPDENGSSVYPDQYALKATVVVRWSSAGQIREIAVDELLTDWRPNF